MESNQPQSNQRAERTGWLALSLSSLRSLWFNEERFFGVTSVHDEPWDTP